MKSHSPEICPVCGEAVPPNSPACPGCGADERAGWNEESSYLDGVDLPESDDDGTEENSYDAFMEREFGVVGWKKRLASVFGVVLVVVMAIYLLRFF